MFQPWLASSIFTYGVDMLACSEQLYHLIYVRQMVQLEKNILEIPAPLPSDFAAKVPFTKTIAKYQEYSRSGIRGS